MRPTCLNTGCNLTVTDNGSRLRPFCSPCHKAGSEKLSARWGIKAFKTGRCQNDGRWGFACGVDYDLCPEAVGMTEIDHIDGDHTNNTAANCIELCPLCHTIKSKRAGDKSRKGGAKYAAAMRG